MKTANVCLCIALVFCVMLATACSSSSGDQSKADASSDISGDSSADQQSGSDSDLWSDAGSDFKTDAPGHDSKSPDQFSEDTLTAEVTEDDAAPFDSAEDSSNSDVPVPDTTAEDADETLTPDVSPDAVDGDDGSSGDTESDTSNTQDTAPDDGSPDPVDSDDGFSEDTKSDTSNTQDTASDDDSPDVVDSDDGSSGDTKSDNSGTTDATTDIRSDDADSDVQIDSDVEGESDSQADALDSNDGADGADQQQDQFDGYLQKLSISVESGNNTTVNAGSDQELVVKVVDQHGTPISGVSVQFEALNGIGSLSTDTASSDVDGLARVTLTTATDVSKINKVTATLANSESVSFTVNTRAGPPALIVKGGETPDAYVGTKRTLTLTLTDEYGNQVGADFELQFSISSSGTFDAGATSETVKTDQNGQASVTLHTSLTPGTESVEVELTSNTAVKASYTIDVIESASYRIVASGDGEKVPAGTDQPIAIQVFNEADQPTRGIGVSLEITAGSGSLSTSTGITDSDGKLSVTLTSDTLPGDNTVEISVDSATTVSVTVVGTPVPSKIVAVVTPSSPQPVGTSATWTVKVTDANNIPVPGATVKFSSVVGGGSVGPTSGVTDVNGEVSTTVTIGQKPIGNRFYAELGGLRLQVVIQAKVGPAAKIVNILGDGETDAAGRVIGLVMQVFDAYDNPLISPTISLEVTAGDGSVTDPAPTGNSSGVVNTLVTLGQTPGTNTFKATIGSASAEFHVQGYYQPGLWTHSLRGSGMSNVGDFKIAPDSSFMVYRERDNTQGQRWDLKWIEFSNPGVVYNLTQSYTPTSIGTFDPTALELDRPQISADSKYVVFRATWGEGYQLFSIDKQTRTITQLTFPKATNPAAYNVHILYTFTTDSQQVLFSGDLDINGLARLYRVPVDGSTLPVILSDPSITNTNQDVVASTNSLQFVHCGPHVYFSGALTTVGELNFYRIELSGDTLTLLKLSDNPATDFAAYPGADGSCVLLAELLIAPQTAYALYRLTDTNSTPRLLSSGLATSLSRFALAPDKSWVAFSEYINGELRLYRNGIDGDKDSVVALSPLNGNSSMRVSQFYFTPDSSTVLFAGDVLTDGLYQFYKNASDGTVATMTLLGDGEGRPSPDLLDVLLLTTSANGVYELRSHPVDGSPATLLSDPNAAPIHRGFEWRADPSNQWVAFDTVPTTDLIPQVYLVSRAGGTIYALTADSTIANPGFWGFTPDGTFIVMTLGGRIEIIKIDDFLAALP